MTISQTQKNALSKLVQLEYQNLESGEQLKYRGYGHWKNINEASLRAMERKGLIIINDPVKDDNWFNNHIIELTNEGRRIGIDEIHESAYKFMLNQIKHESRNSINIMLAADITEALQLEFPELKVIYTFGDCWIINIKSSCMRVNIRWVSWLSGDDTSHIKTIIGGKYFNPIGIDIHEDMVADLVIAYRAAKIVKPFFDTHFSTNGH